LRPCSKSVSNYVDEQKVYKIERNIIHNSKKMHRKPNSIDLPQDTREMSAGGIMILSFSRKGNKGICFARLDKTVLPDWTWWIKR
jgi:hypothetical protein